MGKKDEQLGMSYGAANSRLRKSVLFALLKKYGENICFRCGDSIETERELSLEHKEPWLDRDVALFWDLDNITWSHLSCNSRTSVQRRIELYGNAMGNALNTLSKEDRIRNGKKGRCTQLQMSCGLPCVCGQH